jgi:hypothetical protein
VRPLHLSSECMRFEIVTIFPGFFAGIFENGILLALRPGPPFTQAIARELATLDRVVLLCGRYEGVDERINQLYCDMELSIGDYVLSGGELAAAVVIDAAMRLIPGVLGNEASGSLRALAWPTQRSPLARTAFPGRSTGRAGCWITRTTPAGGVCRAERAGGAAERRPPADSPLAARAAVAQDPGQPARSAGGRGPEQGRPQAAGCDLASKTARCLLERLNRRGLIRAHLAHRNCRDVKVLADGRAAGQTAQHGQLAHVGERIGDGPLQQLLDGRVQRPAGGKKRVKGLERLKETAAAPLPRGAAAWAASAPAPWPQSAPSRTGRPCGPESAPACGRLRQSRRKVVGRAVEGSRRSIGQRGQGVAQQFAFLIHMRNYNAKRGAATPVSKSRAARIRRKTASLIN